MNDSENIEVVKQIYKDFGSGNMKDVFIYFDEGIVWERPGEPDIPFAGTFRGIEGMISMFTLMSESIKIKTFLPQLFFADDDKVAVVGQDCADVVATGKEYTADWVYVFTLQNKKVTHVQIVMDSLSIAKAFQV